MMHTYTITLFINLPARSANDARQQIDRLLKDFGTYIAQIVEQPDEIPDDL